VIGSWFAGVHDQESLKRTVDSDIWQMSIEPVVDFNKDGIVNAHDMSIMVAHWSEDYPLCDIGPTPLGDCTIDVQDLIVLAEHLFEEYPPGGIR